MALGDYVINVYTRLGVLLGEAPCTWTASVGLRRVATLNIEGRAEERMVAAACYPLETVLVLREEIAGGESVVRLAAEVVDFERSRDANGKGTIKISALSPEWRWWSTLVGNYSKISGPNFANVPQQAGLGQPWFAPIGSGIGVVKAWNESAPSIDRAEAAARLVQHVAYAGYDFASSGAPYAGPTALGVRIPPQYGGKYLLHDCGIRAGGWTAAGSTITTRPDDLYRKTAGQLMDELAAGLDGFEWWIDYAQNIGAVPQDDAEIEASYNGATFTQYAGHRTSAHWGDWRAAPVKGGFRDLVYEYGAGRSNVETFTERVSGTAVATAATSPAEGGIAAETDTMQLVTPTEKTAAYSFSGSNALKYGLLDRLVASSVSSYALRKQLTDDAVTIGSRPRQTFTLAPSPKANAGGVWPLRDYQVGDTLRFIVWESPEEIVRSPLPVDRGKNWVPGTFESGQGQWASYSGNGTFPAFTYLPVEKRMRWTVSPTSGGDTNLIHYSGAVPGTFTPVADGETVVVQATLSIDPESTAKNFAPNLQIRVYNAQRALLGAIAIVTGRPSYSGADLEIVGQITAAQIKATHPTAAYVQMQCSMAFGAAGNATGTFSKPGCWAARPMMPLGDAFDGARRQGAPVATLDGIVRVYGFTLNGGPNRETTATVVISDS